VSAFVNSQTVTARKPRRCDDCGRTVIPGERYRRSKSVDYDGWHLWQTCSQCQACVEDLWDAEVREENDDGYECYAYLPDVDWTDVALWSPLWEQRAHYYRQQWTASDGVILDYPTDPLDVTS